jgi:hypothetical protein
MHDGFGVSARAQLVAARKQQFAQLSVVVISPLKTIQIEPSSFEIGWRPVARSMIESRRIPIAMPGSV